MAWSVLRRPPLPFGLRSAPFIFNSVADVVEWILLHKHRLSDLLRFRFALPGSTNFVGTNAQAHLLVMSLNVAKCNLGKVNLEALLVSSFPSYTRGGQYL